MTKRQKPKLFGPNTTGSPEEQAELKRFFETLAQRLLEHHPTASAHLKRISQGLSPRDKNGLDREVKKFGKSDTKSCKELASVLERYSKKAIASTSSDKTLAQANFELMNKRGAHPVTRK